MMQPIQSVPASDHHVVDLKSQQAGTEDTIYIDQEGNLSSAK